MKDTHKSKIQSILCDTTLASCATIPRQMTFIIPRDEEKERKRKGQRGGEEREKEKGENAREIEKWTERNALVFMEDDVVVDVLVDSELDEMVPSITRSKD